LPALSSLVAVSRRPTTLSACSVHTPHTPHAGRQSGRHTHTHPPTSLKSESQSAAVVPDKLFILSFFIHPISSVSALPAAAAY